jgi:DMSO/TMAO reductase YedYZ molybdopterin-dependent catalytic subunit
MTDNSGWRLIVGGAVHNTLNLTLDELVAMPNTTVYAELDCYGVLVSVGNWTGVRLGFLLEKAGIYQEGVSVWLLAQDGYRVSLSIADAMQDYVIIAYELNGEPLPGVLQLVLPGANGSLWIYMITSIIASATPAQTTDYGYWNRFETPTPDPSTIPQQSSTPTQSSTSQPKNQSATPPIIPPSNSSDTTSSTNPSVQQQGFLGSSLPTEYGYAIVAVTVVAIAATTGYLYLKRKK